MQLASPALPIGAFAYSQGLEGAFAEGWIGDEASAACWILGLLGGSVATLDLPVMARVHAAWGRGDRPSAGRWSRFLLCSRPSAELEAEDRHLGRALARVLDGLGVDGARVLVDAGAPTHAALFAVAASAWDVPVLPALAAYAFAWAEAQVGAALRLGRLGQTAGQRILGAAGSAIPAAARAALEAGDDDIGASAPAQAIASARHETQYSRLFRS